MSWHGRRGLAHWSPARQLALLIAVGIGLHNFAEGLAIGQSAASGEIGLALMLVIGFGAAQRDRRLRHRGPARRRGRGRSRQPELGLPADCSARSAADRPSSGRSSATAFTSEPVSVVFLTLAAGSLLYVIIQLIGVAAKAKRTDLLAYGVLLGCSPAFVTDAIVTAAGV